MLDIVDSESPLFFKAVSKDKDSVFIGNSKSEPKMRCEFCLHTVHLSLESFSFLSLEHVMLYFKIDIFAISAHMHNFGFLRSIFLPI